MATKYFTFCRHTGPALPHGTSERIEVKGLCPKCREIANFLSEHRPEVTIAVNHLLGSYRKVKTTRR